MINIKPVSDLRNYNTVLDKVTIGSLVYLTKNGKGVPYVKKHNKFFSNN